MTPKAVIFDCDGVVVDSEPQTLILMRQDLAERGLDLSIEEIERRFIGTVMGDIAIRAREMGGDIPDDWVDQFYARLYADLEHGVALIPGIIQVFDALDAAGIPYAIGSNGSERKMEITLGHYPGLRDRFRAILSGQSIANPKPAPDLYLMAAEALDAAPADCVVIEDSATGARAAKAAGIRCFGYAPNGNPALAAENARLFTDMHDLPGLLGLR